MDDSTTGPAVPRGRWSWWPGLVVGVVVAAVAYGFSAIIGLNVLLTTALLVLLGLGTFSLHRWRGDKDRRDGRTRWGAVIVETGIVAVVLFGVIQVLPFGRMPSNPPVTGEPQWDSPQTRALAVRACYDCHSNEVASPWYASIAPISWALSEHVESGRGKLNFSEFDRPQEDADKAAEVTKEGEMPPAYYTRFGLHATANLTDAELAALVAGFEATPGLSD